MSRNITLFEMGPRDGLQNEKKIIATKDKVKLVDLLSDCGFSKIEVTSFVSARWVPQMADAADVLNRITRKPGVAYTALTPNMKGLQAAIAAEADEVAIFASASEGFSRKNINCSIEESIQRFRPVADLAKEKNLPLRGYVSCVVGCPYDGEVSPDAVARVVSQLAMLGCYEISLGDTIGTGTPETVSDMLDQAIAAVGSNRLAGHYHDTNGRALENIEVSLEKGICTFDASVGGLGGCPYAPGARGNVDTASVVAMLHDKGYETGIDLSRLSKAGEFALELLQ
ncbi:MAG: hydroxymethylglutaryl-CoA lyase [Methyloligellaceae bacterium]